jgi:hypothetical protein
MCPPKNVAPGDKNLLEAERAGNRAVRNTGR